jgi:hypothetical protein
MFESSSTESQAAQIRLAANHYQHMGRDGMAMCNSTG